MKKLEMDSESINNIPKEERSELKRLVDSGINLKSVFVELIDGSYHVKRLWLNLNENKLDRISFKHLETLRAREGYLRSYRFQCPHLKELSLTFINIADFSFLGYLEKLQKLYIQNCNLAQFSAPKSLHALFYLDLSHNKLTTLSDLNLSDNLANTQEIILFKNQISDLCDFEPLSNLPKLRNLNLSSNKITEIDVKQELPSLEELYLFHNNISAVKNLRNLPHLITLDLSNNELTQLDFKNFKNLSSLTNIFIDENPFDKVFAGGNPINSLLNLKYAPKRVKIKRFGDEEFTNNELSSVKRFDTHLHTIGWRYVLDTRCIERIPEPYAELDIGDHIKLRLEYDKIELLVNDEYFDFCAVIVAQIPVEKLEEVNSVDDLIPYEKDLEDHSSKIPLKAQFWAHASNLQAWVEHEYDTRLLHRNIAFPLLEKLTKVGDPLAKKKFKAEIAKRYSSGNPTVIEFLNLGGYLNYLSDEEMSSLKMDI